MPRKRTISCWSITLGVLLAGGLNSPASADTVSCTYLPGGSFLPPLVSVQITPSGGTVGALDRPGSDIVAVGENGLVDCGNGTVLNTAAIALGDASPQSAGNVRSFKVPVGSTAFFSPGFGAEPGDSDEIEFGVAFGPGNDVLGLDAIHGDGGPVTIRLGTDGEHDYVNLNAAETTGIDQDISMEGVDKVQFEAFPAPVNDDISGAGGAGTGDLPFPLKMEVNVGAGDDLVRGGTSGDLFVGAAGADTLVGGPGPGSLDGGAQTDRLFGGPQPDLLFGGLAADVLYGKEGKDLLRGESGADVMKAGSGPDQLKGGDGADVLAGGPGFDVCVGGAGDDSFSGCEAITP